MPLKIKPEKDSNIGHRGGNMNIVSSLQKKVSYDNEPARLALSARNGEADFFAHTDKIEQQPAGILDFPSDDSASGALTYTVLSYLLKPI